jgi:secretion protein hlyD family protein
MKKPIVMIVLLAAVAACWYGWQHWRPQGQDAGVFYGNIDVRQVSLAFEGSGRVAQVDAEEGDRVQSGQVLAVLDTRTLALQADQAAAQLRVQEENLRRLKNGARPAEIAQARSRLAAAQADAQRARREQARLERIATASAGAVSVQDVDRARSAARVAQAAVKERQDALALVQEGARREEIDAADAQVAAARAQLALLRHQLDQGELRAPVASVVRSRLLEPGDMASPQRPVLALAVTSPKWARIYVDESSLGQVKPGQTAQLSVDSMPGRTLAGRVGYISSVAEFTPKSVQTEVLRTSLVYEVRVLVDDPDDVLRLGQPVTVRLESGTADRNHEGG